MNKSLIDWTEMTWNPVTGCTKVSVGCENCYAERIALRLKAMGQRNYRNGFSVTLHPHMLDVPLKWRSPRIVFVNSTSDLFHEDVPFFFKQWGGTRKKIAGRELDGRTYEQMPVNLEVTNFA